MSGRAPTYGATTRSVSELQRPTSLRGRSGDDDGAPDSSLGHTSSDRIDFEFYHRKLQRGWKLLLLGAVVGAVLGLSLAMSRPTLYEGVTTLMASPAPGADRGSINLATLTPLFKDLTLASEIVEELRLRDAPHTLTPQSLTTNHVIVEEDNEAKLLKVRVRLADAALAAAASRRLSDKAIVLNGRINERRSSFERDTIKKQLEKATERLESAETELLKFQQHAQVDLLKEDAEALLAERGDMLELGIQIESERARLRAAEQELRKVPRLVTHPRDVLAEDALHRAGIGEDRGTASSGKGTRTELGQGQVAATKEGSRRARRAGQDLVTDTVDPEVPDQSRVYINPVYQTLEYQIATTRLRLAALERQQREIADIQKLGGDAPPKLNLYYQRRLELARHESDYQVAARIRSDLLLKHEQAAASATTVSPQLHLVNEAVAADTPLSRRGIESSALGLAIGLLAAGFLVVVRANGRFA